jgi:hypothetical protein
LNHICLREPEQADFFLALALHGFDMESLAPQGFLKTAIAMEEKIKWDETKTSEKGRKREKTGD